MGHASAELRHSPLSGLRALFCWVLMDAQAVWTSAATHPPTPPAPRDQGLTLTCIPIQYAHCIQSRVKMCQDVRSQ